MKIAVHSILIIGTLCLMTACGGSSKSVATQSLSKPRCGVNDRPEGAIQGRVSAADRESGRSREGYQCNLEIVSQFQGEGTSWVSPSSGSCAYLSTSFLGALSKKSPGVQVVDVSDSSRPVLTGSLQSPAMLIGPWESLKVNEQRKLLGAVAVGPFLGAAFFDVYDISGDCANPTLLNKVLDSSFVLPANVLGHEGNWSPDGNTYWSTGLMAGAITAIDVSDPTKPSILYTSVAGLPVNHGFEFSEDGNRLYLSVGFPAGLIILDISDIQNRNSAPQLRSIGEVYWADQGMGQHVVPVHVGDRPYLIAVDEFAGQGVHIVDISDETKPKVVSEIKLQIQLPEHEALRIEDTEGNGLFGYEAHYCDVDNRVNPSALACGFFQSGIRVFDIRDLRTPIEIAYFNPPAQSELKSQLPGSEHANGWTLMPAISEFQSFPQIISSYALSLTRRSNANLSADWCSSPPRFVGDQLWVACQDNGFMVLRFTNNVYPFK